MTALPIDSLRTPRFCGVPTFMRLPTAASLTGLDAAVIGLPSRQSLPYRRAAPRHKGDLGDAETDQSVSRQHQYLRGGWRSPMSAMPRSSGYEEESLEALEKSVRSLIDADVTPFAIGGDHRDLGGASRCRFALWPSRAHPFDSHTDTWDSYFAGKRYSAGTPFRRAVREDLVAPNNSIQIGMRGSLFQGTDISQSLALGYDVLTCCDFRDGVPGCCRRESRRAPAVQPASLPSIWISSTLEVRRACGLQSGGPTAREALLLCVASTTFGWSVAMLSK